MTASQYFKGRTVQEQMNEVIGYVDTRSAEVATSAIASDVAQVHQDMLDADADASAAAASAAAAAGTLANAVKKTGEASQSIAGDIAVAGNLTGGTVTVPAPVNNTDAASKKYVDDQDALDAKLAGATFTGQVNATGQRAYAPGNTTDVATIGTLDAYAPMVRTSDNQTIGGSKLFTGVTGLASDSYEYQVGGDGNPHYLNSFYWYDKNQTLLGRIYLNVDPDGKTAIGYEVLNTDGSHKYGILAIGDVI